MRRQHRERQRHVVDRPHLGQRGRRQRQRQPRHRPAVAAVGDRRPHPVARLLQRRVGQADEMHTGQPRGDVGLDLDDLAVQPAHRHRERPPQRHHPTPCRWVISGVAPATDPHADDVDAHLRPAAVLAGQPQPGQPTQPAHLLRRHRLRHTAELVSWCASSPRRTPPRGRGSTAITSSSPYRQRQLRSSTRQPKRGQMLDRQLLTQRPDLGAAPMFSVMTPPSPAARTHRDRRYGNHPQSRVHPQPTATSQARSDSIDARHSHRLFVATCWGVKAPVVAIGLERAQQFGLEFRCGRPCLAGHHRHDAWHDRRAAAHALEEGRRRAPTATSPALVPWRARRSRRTTTRADPVTR